MSINSFGITRGFILPNGEIAKNGTRHDDIAMEYLNNHPKIREIYDKKQCDLCDFMVQVVFLADLLYNILGVLRGLI